MPFPAHIAALLDRYRVRTDTKAALYDLYLSLGNPVLDSFADLAERAGDPALIAAEDLTTLRAATVERYVRENHPKWISEQPTRSLWHPRRAEGRAAGLAVPLGRIGQENGQPTEFAAAVEARVRSIVGPSQPLPPGLLILGRDAHYGGRADTVSFDVVAADVDDAVQIALAEGQQHTIPGSVGATSGSVDSGRGIALIWEIQPNVYKPAGERNRAIAKIYRRHRNWHVATSVAAMEWLSHNHFSIYVLRGPALQAAHEVNWRKPVVEQVMALHERTVGTVVAASGCRLETPSAEEAQSLLLSGVMNTGLTRHVTEHGLDEAVSAVRGMPEE